MEPEVRQRAGTHGRTARRSRGYGSGLLENGSWYQRRGCGPGLILASSPNRPNPQPRLWREHWWRTDKKRQLCRSGPNDSGIELKGRAKQCPEWSPCRSGRAEQRSSGRIRAGACLSEASLHPTPPDASSARNPKGPDCGSPFFAYFLWRSKESKCAAGRNPGQRRSKRAQHLIGI